MLGYFAIYNSRFADQLISPKATASRSWLGWLPHQIARLNAR